RSTLLDILQLSNSEEDALACDRQEVQRMVRQIRKQGYAFRAPGIRPVSGTLAVPVFERKRVVASIGVTWFASTLNNEQAAERFLEPLQSLAHDVGRRLVA